jgi:hypothetical protein
MEKSDWRVGVISILEFMRDQFDNPQFCWRTVCRWKKIGMPLHRTRSGKPFIIPAEVINWQLKNK